MGLLDFLRLLWRSSLGPGYEKQAERWRRAKRLRKFFRSRDVRIDQSGLDWLRKLTPTRAPVTRLIGRGADGSYIVPDINFGPLSVFSPGVGGVVEFELALANEGHDIYLADGTIAELPHEHPNFYFVNKNIGFADHEVRLEDWIETVSVAGRSAVLQMDIEGAEWHALQPDGISDATLNRLEWMVIEFHNFERYWIPEFRSKADIALGRVLERFTPIVSHANNCAPTVRIGARKIPTVFEVTFLNRRHLDLATVTSPNLPVATHKNCPRRRFLRWPFNI